MKNLIYTIILGLSIAGAYASEGSLAANLKDAAPIKTMQTLATTSTTTQDIAEMSTSTTTSTTTSTSTEIATDTPNTCDLKNKLNIRKEKVNKQIKNQLIDKNKLVDSLLEVASSTNNDEDKTLIESKIIELETQVLSMIKSQKEVINIINSTNEISCSNQSKLKREYDKTLIKIKKLNTEIEKKADSVNNLIKNEIRQAVVNIDDQA